MKKERRQGGSARAGVRAASAALRDLRVREHRRELGQAPLADSGGLPAEHRERMGGIARLPNSAPRTFRSRRSNSSLVAKSVAIRDWRSASGARRAPRAVRARPASIRSRPSRARPWTGSSGRRRRGTARGVGDVPHGRSREALAPEERERRVEDVLPRRLALGSFRALAGGRVRQNIFEHCSNIIAATRVGCQDLLNNVQNK